MAEFRYAYNNENLMTLMAFNCPSHKSHACEKRLDNLYLSVIDSFRFLSIKKHG